MKITYISIPIVAVLALASSITLAQEIVGEGSASSSSTVGARAKTPANAGRILKRIEGSRRHTSRNTDFAFVVEDIVVSPDSSQEFTGTLVFYGNAGVSKQPLSGRFRDDGSLRLTSRFVTSQSDHSVRMQGTVEGTKFSGTEGDYGTVSAILFWAE